VHICNKADNSPLTLNLMAIPSLFCNVKDLSCHVMISGFSFITTHTLLVEVYKFVRVNVKTKTQTANWANVNVCMIRVYRNVGGAWTGTSSDEPVTYIHTAIFLTYVHLVSRLRTRGAILGLLQHVLMARFSNLQGLVFSYAEEQLHDVCTMRNTDLS
jgi:hypothetical protein